MKWTEFSKELWGLIPYSREAHAWAVEQYRNLQRWNEEIREERDEARGVAEDLLCIIEAEIADFCWELPWEEEK